jgi:hypothetical protein
MSAWKKFCAIVGTVHKTITVKLTQFMEDEKVCNKKLKTFLKDVDNNSIRNQEATADNDWLYFGKYEPVFTGPFAPLPEKKKKDKVINIILK